ncbi:hypothetical protein IEQ34_000104 [Dendrobium chrysotoxum]|uniref:Uncharacterized protein n=1 Tax=Dendrobium chrysotoxum TaxID=161865 RepID=A0AAV7HN70_DENCH|nr:hypothetical protein IEQ34_000104 [Dendrobium chrysotoxum]
MSIIFIGLKGYCYAYMMTCWVPISMEVVRNNLYPPRNNPSLVLEMDEVAACGGRRTIRMEFTGLGGDGFAGGGERVRCGCQGRAFSRVEPWRSGVQKKGEGDHLDYHSEEAQNGGGTNALLFTGYANIFIDPKGYCYAYMKPYWVPISMKVVGNNLYEPMLSAQALAVIESLEVMEECGVEVRLELSLGLSSSEVECRKWVRETNEIVVVKNLKMEEGPLE